MRSIKVWKWVLTGAFFGTFVFHPLVMIIGHLMEEPPWANGHSVLYIILHETSLAFSPEMMPWTLSFAILGALIGLFYGRARHANNALEETEMRFRSVAESAVDGITSINTVGEIISWNRVAQDIFGYTDDEIIGQSLTVLMPERYREAHRKGIERHRSTGESRVLGKTVELYGITKGGMEFPLELSLATWKMGEEAFYTGIIRDISVRKGLAREREDLILELKAALDNVKTLSGMLPICANCKKVRDDKGYWNQIEAYISDRSEAKFSHGICPECAKKLYPDFV